MVLIFVIGIAQSYTGGNTLHPPPTISNMDLTGQCIQFLSCDFGYYFDVGNCDCELIDVCDGNHRWNYQTNSCVCIHQISCLCFPQDRQSCECPAVPCPAPLHYDLLKCSCQCPDSTIPDMLNCQYNWSPVYCDCNQCVDTFRYVWNSTLGQCVCRPPRNCTCGAFWMPLSCTCSNPIQDICGRRPNCTSLTFIDPINTQYPWCYVYEPEISNFTAPATAPYTIPPGFPSCYVFNTTTCLWIPPTALPAQPANVLSCYVYNATSCNWEPPSSDPAPIANTPACYVFNRTTCVWFPPLVIPLRPSNVYDCYVWYPTSCIWDLPICPNGYSFQRYTDVALSCTCTPFIDNCATYGRNLDSTTSQAYPMICSICAPDFVLSSNKLSCDTSPIPIQEFSCYILLPGLNGMAWNPPICLNGNSLIVYDTTVVPKLCMCALSIDQCLKYQVNVDPVSNGSYALACVQCGNSLVPSPHLNKCVSATMPLPTCNTDVWDSLNYVWVSPCTGNTVNLVYDSTTVPKSCLCAVPISNCLTYSLNTNSATSGTNPLICNSCVTSYTLSADSLTCANTSIQTQIYSCYTFNSASNTWDPPTCAYDQNLIIYDNSTSPHKCACAPPISFCTGYILNVDPTTNSEFPLACTGCSSPYSLSSTSTGCLDSTGALIQEYDCYSLSDDGLRWIPPDCVSLLDSDWFLYVTNPESIFKHCDCYPIIQHCLEYTTNPGTSSSLNCQVCEHGYVVPQCGPFQG